jgi:hypothetical protein
MTVDTPSLFGDDTPPPTCQHGRDPDVCPFCHRHDGTDWSPRREGMDAVQAPDPNQEWLTAARDWAKRWLLDHPGETITTDHVRRAIPPEEHGVTSNSVVGTLFLPADFVAVGWHESVDQKAHSRMARTWRLR